MTNTLMNKDDIEKIRQITPWCTECGRDLNSINDAHAHPHNHFDIVCSICVKMPEKTFC